MKLETLRMLTQHYREALDICGGESLSGPLGECAKMLNQMADWLGTPTEPRPASTMDAEVVYLSEPDQKAVRKALFQFRFIQGVFFAKGIWTWEEIEEHNRTGHLSTKRG